MRDLYSEVLESNEYKAGKIAHYLQGLQPAVAAGAFI
jgi:hypothetical protein